MERLYCAYVSGGASMIFRSPGTSSNSLAENSAKLAFEIRTPFLHT
jgi:hypothetical protein